MSPPHFRRLSLIYCLASTGCASSAWDVPITGDGGVVGVDGGVNGSDPTGAGCEPGTASGTSEGCIPGAGTDDTDGDDTNGDDSSESGSGQGSGDDGTGESTGGNAGGAGGSDSTTDPEEVLNCEGPQAPRHRLVHLTRQQFDRTIGDILQTPVSFADTLPEDEKVVGFASPAQVDNTLARGWWDAASVVSSRFAETALDEVVRIADCEVASGAECVTKFVNTLGRRAFRRPLTQEETLEYVQLFDDALADGNSEAESLGSIVQAMFVSPNFLFRVETPPAVGEVRALDQYELASRLSLFLWGMGPDDELLNAAEQNELTMDTSLEAHVDRMLESENARWLARDFVRQWMQLDPLKGVAFAPEAFGSTPLSFEPKDSDAFFAADGEAELQAPPDKVQQPGWYVWDIPADRVTAGVSRVQIDVVVTTSATVDIGVSVNDTPILDTIDLGPGEHTIEAPISLNANSAAKVGVVVRNATQEQTVEMVELRLATTGSVNTDLVPAALIEQAERYFEQTVFDLDGDLNLLFTSREYPVNSTLAPLLGVQSDSESWSSATVEDERVGLLTLPGVLVAHGGSYNGGTSPIKRGVWLMDRVLCLPHPAPLPQLPDYCNNACEAGSCGDGSECVEDLCVPESALTCEAAADCGAFRACVGGRCVADPEFCIPSRTLDQTTRQWWDGFGSTCHACHTSINGVGYALEHFDGIGRYRDTEPTSEGDEAIDARGLVTLSEPIEFYGASGLVDTITTNSIGGDCYSSSWFSYAFGQVADGHLGAQCTEKALHDKFTANNQGLRGFIRDIALSDGFRNAAAAETTDP